MNLDDLRSHLSGLDRRLLELIAERQRVSREIARVKRATGHPTRDYAREREVILAVRSGAAELGVPADAAEEVMRVLIRSSLATQEQASVAAGGAGSGRRALVIGGAGKIGGWFAQFLGSQGFDVEIADPAGGRWRWRAGRLAHEPAAARLHRRRHAARRDRRDPARARAAPARRRRLRRRLAEDAAARRPRGAARRRRARQLASTRCSARTPSCSPGAT